MNSPRPVAYNAHYTLGKYKVIGHLLFDNEWMDGWIDGYDGRGQRQQRACNPHSQTCTCLPAHRSKWVQLSYLFAPWTDLIMNDACCGGRHRCCSYCRNTFVFRDTLKATAFILCSTITYWHHIRRDMMAAIQRVTAPLLFVCKWGKGCFGKTEDTFAPLASSGAHNANAANGHPLLWVHSNSFKHMVIGCILSSRCEVSTELCSAPGATQWCVGCLYFFFPKRVLWRGAFCSNPFHLRKSHFYFLNDNPSWEIAKTLGRASFPCRSLLSPLSLPLCLFCFWSAFVQKAQRGCSRAHGVCFTVSFL